MQTREIRSSSAFVGKGEVTKFTGKRFAKLRLLFVEDAGTKEFPVSTGPIAVEEFKRRDGSSKENELVEECKRWPIASANTYICEE